VLRLFEDRLVARLPSPAELERVRELFCDSRVEVLATEGLPLSQQMQDAASFRYGLINLGGRDLQDIEQSLEACLSVMTFDLRPIAN